MNSYRLFSQTLLKFWLKKNNHHISASLMQMFPFLTLVKSEHFKYGLSMTFSFLTPSLNFVDLLAY